MTPGDTYTVFVVVSLFLIFVLAYCCSIFCHLQPQRYIYEIKYCFRVGLGLVPGVTPSYNITTFTKGSFLNVAKGPLATLKKRTKWFNWMKISKNINFS